MKKYLMMGAAALTMGFAFVSCSSDDVVYNPDAAQDQAIANYKKAFIEAFGQPDAKQDWGFGTSSRATRGADKKLPTNPTESAKPGVPEFSTSVPANTPKASKSNWRDNGIFYIDNEAVELENPQNQSNVTIYARGNNVIYPYATNQNGNGTKIIVTEGSTLTLNSVSERLTVYLSPNATLNLPNGGTFAQDNAKLYMSANSNIVVGEGQTLRFTSKYTALNDGGTIDAPNLVVYDGALLYNANGSTIKNAAITVHNISGDKGSELVNEGDLESIKSIAIGAGAKMFNTSTGVASVLGKTHVANSNSAWKNDGQFTTGDFEVSDYAEQVYNNCKLTVHKNTNEGEFKIYGKFVLDGGASVITDKLYFVDNSYIFMGGKSLFDVKGQFFTTNDDSVGGIYGFADDYAVVKAGSITHNGDDQYRMSYFGNLFIDTNNHFAQGSKDGKDHATTSQPYYYYDNTVSFSFNGSTSPVSIPTSTCNPGYNNGGGITYQGRIMAEDLTVKEKSDLDFNDVVFCWAIENNKAYIKLEAAGGTLPLYIGGAPNEGNTEIIGGKEVHADLFKVPVTTMVNTGLTVKEPVEFTLDDKEYTRPEDIRIFVKKGDKYIEMTAPEGQPTSKINVPVATKWVDEYVNISNAYTWFSNWVQDKNTTTSWNNPVERFVDYILSNNAITVTE